MGSSMSRAPREPSPTPLPMLFLPLGVIPGNAQLGHGPPPVTAIFESSPAAEYAAWAPDTPRAVIMQVAWLYPVGHPLADWAASRALSALAKLNERAAPLWFWSMASR